MRHGSLFSGIGGFDLAAQWMGWENVFQVEIDPFCQKVLEKNFPNVKRYGDIKEFDGTKYRGAVDVLSGGFPCQPFSFAGKRKGKDDVRFLWPEMLRIIGQVRPPFIVGENVSGSWQLVDEICTDLENIGFTTEPVGLEAASIGKHHKRFRWWFIAYTNGKREWELLSINKRIDTEKIRKETSYGPTFIHDDTNWQEWEHEPLLCGTSHGIPRRLDRIKGLGNAIVPQVAYEIFEAIETSIQKVA